MKHLSIRFRSFGLRIVLAAAITSPLAAPSMAESRYARCERLCKVMYPAGRTYDKTTALGACSSGCGAGLWSSREKKAKNECRKQFPPSGAGNRDACIRGVDYYFGGSN